MTESVERCHNPTAEPERDRDEQTGGHGVAPEPALEAAGPADGACADGLAGQEAAQVFRELPSGGVAPGGRLGHCLQADGFEIAGDLIVKLTGRPRLVVHDLEEEHAAIAPERALAGQELVEHDAGAVNVGAGHRTRCDSPRACSGDM